ncbi:hypothetical protein LCGC14_0471020 [marine sediment metagenome]|uniref:Uncharacterized protein n=1 Tax=marine sediment metagenome TaxID=412755 RepID=A0A0F9SV20_9ZZZZ
MNKFRLLCLTGLLALASANASAATVNVNFDIKDALGASFGSGSFSGDTGADNVLDMSELTSFNTTAYYGFASYVLADLNQFSDFTLPSVWSHNISWGGFLLGGNNAYFTTDSLALDDAFFDVNITSVSTAPVSAVPIPAAALLFAPALLGFMGLRRRKLAA